MNKSTSTLEMAMLGLMKQKRQSGYDLRKTFATTAMRHYSDSPGSIYPALRRLEARGWIEPVTVAAEQPEDRRRRQEFRLTRDGEATLKAWLELPLAREDVSSRRDELMMRFAFMDGNVPRSTTVRFLEQLARELDLYAGELRAQFEQMSCRMPLHTGVLAFQSGIEGMEAQIAWARKVRARLAESEEASQ
jgi:DNA-binding PadR family transcriptional regulator